MTATSHADTQMSNQHDYAWQKAREAAKRVLEPTCVTCHKDLTGKDWTIDHIIPLNKGGTHDLANLQSMCRECNGRKQDIILVRDTWRSPKWY